MAERFRFRDARGLRASIGRRQDRPEVHLENSQGYPACWEASDEAVMVVIEQTQSFEMAPDPSKVTCADCKATETFAKAHKYARRG